MGVLARAGAGGRGRGGAVDDEEVGVGLEAQHFLALRSGVCPRLVGGVGRAVVGHDDDDDGAGYKFSFYDVG